MGKGSRNAALLAESRDRIKAQEELAMATIAGNMAVDMQGERSISWAGLLLRHQFVTPSVMLKREIAQRFFEG